MAEQDNTSVDDFEEEEISQFSPKVSFLIFLATVPILIVLASASNFIPGIVEPNSEKPVIEYVVYAVLLGLLISNISVAIPTTRIPYRKFKGTIRTELLLKIGLVVYGAKIGTDFAKVGVLAGYFLAAFIQA